MGTRHVLIGVASAQLAAGTAGQMLALRDGRAFDVAVLRWRGRPDRVARDSWLLGTGLSAPVVMLATQGVAIARLAVGPSRRATRTLGALGVMMLGGYLVEREFRTAFLPGGRDRVVTPVAAVAFGSAIPMAVLGLNKEPTKP